ncbi:MAG: type II toxin-antitoxin system RelE/ParE family toxin [Maricaulis sp.]|nr:type II toxin-antitoxin system RelE/ParE family toxin [Maricaulis sp.]
MRLILSDPALADLERLRRFLTDKNPEASRRAAAVIMQAFETLKEFPKRGTPSRRSGLRELVIPFGQAAYIVRYALDEAMSELIILRVWHGREERHKP